MIAMPETKLINNATMKLLMQNWNEQRERTNFFIYMRKRYRISVMLNENLLNHRSVSSCISKFVCSRCSFQFCMRSFIVVLLINLVSGIAMSQRCPADLLGFDVSISAFKFNHWTLFLF